MLKESVVADLRSEKKTAEHTTVYPEKVVTLSEFVKDANRHVNRMRKHFGNRNFFVIATFPDGSVVEIKFKFAPKVVVPPTHMRYLNHIIDEIDDVYDDGGFGSWINVTNERVTKTE